MRLALGASRRRIITQLLTEGLTLALSGAAVGLALSYWTTRALALSMMAVMPLEVVFDVLRLILNDGLRLAGAGLALGVPLAVLLSLAFTKVFVEIGGIDPLVIGVATTVLGAAAVAASAIPAWRAARIVPLKALRTE